MVDYRYSKNLTTPEAKEDLQIQWQLGHYPNCVWTAKKHGECGVGREDPLVALGFRMMLSVPCEERSGSVCAAMHWREKLCAETWGPSLSKPTLVSIFVFHRSAVYTFKTMCRCLWSVMSPSVGSTLPEPCNCQIARRNSSYSERHNTWHMLCSCITKKHMVILSLPCIGCEGVLDAESVPSLQQCSPSLCQLLNPNASQDPSTWQCMPNTPCHMSCLAATGQALGGLHNGHNLQSGEV